jgi:hypothetical protein
MRKIHLDKFPDKPHVLKTSVMFVSENRICDGCDCREVRCVSLHLLGGGVSILCQDCIEGILESLDTRALRDIKITKILK